MKKINWFARLFLKWSTIEEFILKNNNFSQNNGKLEATNEELNKRIIELKDRIEEQKNSITEKVVEISELKKQNTEVEAKVNLLNSSKSQTEKDLIIKNSELEGLKNKLQQNRNELDKKWSEINSKLTPLDKIEKTFFSKTGNKGKGEMGELQVKTILEKSGFPSDFWVENLLVNGKQVEFAIKSDSKKWIPIDSKVIEAKIDEEGLAIIDESYKSRVKTQAKEITKYIGKSNTAAYGLLVLQSDSIYMKLFDLFPTFFQDVIKEHKIYICSPSSFIQFSWSISNLLEVHERVHNDEKIYDQMISILKTISSLSTSLYKTHKDFNIAMNKHYPALQKKQTKLVKKLASEGKIKELPTFNDTSEEK